MSHVSRCFKKASVWTSIFLGIHVSDLNKKKLWNKVAKNCHVICEERSNYRCFCPFSKLSAQWADCGSSMVMWLAKKTYFWTLLESHQILPVMLFNQDDLSDFNQSHKSTLLSEPWLKQCRYACTTLIHMYSMRTLKFFFVVISWWCSSILLYIGSFL